MAGIFRSYTTSEKDRRATETKGKQNTKSARAFWETQVRSSRVVQVKRGALEQSVAGGPTDGNDSDGSAVSTMMEIKYDGRSTRGGSGRNAANGTPTSQSGNVEDAEAAIIRMVRGLRNELDIMHEEDMEISLRLASLQGEIASLEDEISQTHYSAYFHRSVTPVCTTPVDVSVPAPDGVVANRKSVISGTSRDEQSDDSSDEIVKARRDSMREKRVVSGLKFKRVNSYHGLQSARVVLKPVAPAESIDRLEWNKPHLWPSQRAPLSQSVSSSGHTSAYWSDSRDVSLDSAFDQQSDPTYAVPQPASRSSSVRVSNRSSTDSSTTQERSSIASTGNVSLDGDRQQPNGGDGNHIVPRRPGLEAVPKGMDNDLCSRAVSGIHSDEILAMYMQRETSIRSELGLLPQGSKSSPLSKSDSKGIITTDLTRPKRPPLTRSNGSFRSTERIAGSVASSHSFRSSLRRRGEAGSKTSPPTAVRPNHSSSSITTEC